MKVAILMAGPYRGNEGIIQHQLNMIGSYDTFVSCFDHYKQDWINSGWPIKDIFITPNIKFLQTNWSKYRNDAPGQSGFWQFWNLKSVIDSVPRQYDFYIKSRSDLLIEEKLNIDFFNLEKDVLYCSAHSFHKKEWEPSTWLNDEFYIGSAYVMDIIAKFVTDYYTVNHHEPNVAYASNEARLLDHLKQNKVGVCSFPNFKYSKDNKGVSVPTGYTGEYQLEV